MASISQDFSKVSFIDKKGINFCGSKKDDTVTVTSEDGKVKNESVPAFLSEISNAEKIVSLERTPEKDTVETKSENGLNEEIKYTEDYKKDNKLTPKGFSTVNLKNDKGTDVDIKEGFFGKKTYNGIIDNNTVSLKSKSNLFHGNKGKVSGTINGEEVEFTYKYDDKKDMIIEGLDDKYKNVGQTISNYTKYITAQRNIALAMAFLASNGMRSSNDMFNQQNMMNEQIRMQNEIMNQQIWQQNIMQQNMINQQILGMM